MSRKPKEPTSLQRARKAHADRMRAAGFKPKTFWISAEAIPALERLAVGKTDSDAINAALIAAANTSQGHMNVADELRAMAVRNNEPGPVARDIQRARATASKPKLDTSSAMVHPSLQKEK